jgi:hypothetical protein
MSGPVSVCLPSYDWYVRLTTPRRWCEGAGPWCRRHWPHRPRVRRRRQQTNRETTESTIESTIAPEPAEPRPRAEPREQQPRERETVQLGFSGVQGHEGALTAPAPPPYQAAVSYPVASSQQPPAYSEKVPPLPGQIEGAALPYPPATGQDPAYPPPLQGPGLPYPS